MELVCDDQAAPDIASSPEFQERIEYIQAAITEKILSRDIVTRFIMSNDHPNILTMSIIELATFDQWALTSGRMLDLLS